MNGRESLKDEKFEIAATNLVEQEERRMSDLSDFCWSVTSSVDNQVRRNSKFVLTGLRFCN